MPIRQEKEVRMATKTSDEVLAQLHRQIAELQIRGNGSAFEARAHLEHRFERLRAQEASAYAAVREKAEAVDEQFRQLEIDIAIAENRLASELADDAGSYAEAVEAELHEWDAAIERLQTRAATRPENAREAAEAEIAALRQARNIAAGRLHVMRVSADAWQEQRDGVRTALDELERNFRAAAQRIDERRKT
jgi:gas vesicle protein